MSDASANVRRLRVAQFTDNYGPGSNGLMFAVQQLEGNLLDAGHEVIVVAPRAKGPNPHAGRPGRTELRIPSMRVPSMPTRVANGRHFQRTIDRLAELKPDVLHVHGFGVVGFLGVLAAKRLGVPMMMTWHTDFDAYADHYSAVLPILDQVLKGYARYTRGEVMDSAALRQAQIRFESRGKSQASLLGLSQRMLEAAVLVTTPSPKTAGRCLELAPAAKVMVVPNGVDPLPEGPPPVPREAGPLVLYAGRIAPEKGMPLLISAFRLVRARRPDARLMIVGDWQRYPRIKRLLASCRDEGWLALPGEQKRDDLGAFYQMCDIFAFPSLTDTQALVLHEAALAGKPIVSVDAGLQLVINPGVNGEITRPTAASMATGLLSVIDRLADPEWQQAAAAESRRLASQWTIESQAEAMLALYAQVADTPRVAPQGQAA